jgi:hypothetical protein
MLTGRGSDVIVIDDPLKPDEALSETQRKTVNDWYGHTLISRRFLFHDSEGLSVVS